jgi:hypothetical protein
MLTRQEIFDNAYAHAKTMKTVSKGRNKQNFPNKCFYRAPNGEKCLIGGLIPDEKYIPSMEMKNVAALIRNNPLTRQIFIDIGLIDEPVKHSDEHVQYDMNQLTFLSRLQYCHDAGSVDTLEKMFQNLIIFANEQNLVVPE